MSYSRWSNSTWDTFWCSTPESNTKFKWPSQRLMDLQAFEICGEKNDPVLYKEIREEGTSAVIQKLKKCFESSITVKRYKDEIFNQLMSGDIEYEDLTDENYKNIEIEGREYTDEEYQELEGYLKRFEEDIKSHFSFPKYFIYNFYYPIRNKIWSIFRTR